MNAEIIAVGSEMLTPEKTDTNSLWLTQQLNDLGVEVVGKAVVGDDRGRLSGAIRGAMERSALVICTGGLGPTEDDLTREALSDAIGRSLQFREDIAHLIEERFRRANRVMSEVNKRQAYIIDGADVLPNDRGSAPGQMYSSDGKTVVLLPGPPNELKAMWSREVLPRLTPKLPPQIIRTLHWRVAGMPESDLDQLISPVYAKYTNPATTILAAASDISIHLRAHGDTPEGAEKLLEEVSSQIAPLLGDRLYSRDGRPLEEHVVQMLLDCGKSVCVAESATGGMLGQRLTSVQGSSNVFRGGFLTYTDEAKQKVLGVSDAVLKNYGAVSEPVAHAMAAGARERFDADFGLSVTGFAGPGGGTEENPVGTIYIGLAAKDAAVVKRYNFLGDRGRIRQFSAQAALDLLRRRLMKLCG